MASQAGLLSPFPPGGVLFWVELVHESIDERLLHRSNGLPDLPSYAVIFPVRDIREFHRRQQADQFSRKEESNGILIRLCRIEFNDMSIGSAVTIGGKEEKPPVIETLRASHKESLRRAVPHRHHGAASHQASGGNFCELSSLVHHL